MTVSVGLTIESTGESCPSFSMENIIVIKAVPITADADDLTIVLPKSLRVSCILPSTRGTPTFKDKGEKISDESEETYKAPQYTAPSGTKVGDRFFLLGHYY